MIGIYEIFNRKTNKRYIGSSANIEKRFKTHKRQLKNGCHNNYLLQKDWEKYGEKCFSFNVIEECDVENLLEREKYYIAKNDTLNHKYGYNRSPIIQVDGKLKQYVPKTKLTNKTVFIIKLLLLYGAKVSSISKKLKINSNTIYQIRNDKAYYDVIPDIMFADYSFFDVWNEWQLFGYGFDDDFLIMNIKELICEKLSILGYNDDWYIKEGYDLYNVLYGVTPC